MHDPARDDERVDGITSTRCGGPPFKATLNKSIPALFSGREFGTCPNSLSPNQLLTRSMTRRCAPRLRAGFAVQPWVVAGSASLCCGNADVISIALNAVDVTACDAAPTRSLAEPSIGIGSFTELPMKPERIRTSGSTCGQSISPLCRAMQVVHSNRDISHDQPIDTHCSDCRSDAIRLHRIHVQDHPRCRRSAGCRCPEQP